MRKWLIAILILSVVFGAGFAAGGAGIYGSPFVSVTPTDPDATQRANERQNLLMALTILIGPIACGWHWRSLTGSPSWQSASCFSELSVARCSG
jgi:hypothetical protein